MKYTQEELATAQREFEGQIKLVNTIISAFGIASKNKRAMVGLERMNIMNESAAVDLGLAPPEEDKVKCTSIDKLITRAECLERSGSNEHYEDCQGCETGKACRRICKIISHDEAFRQGIDDE